MTTVREKVLFVLLSPFVLLITYLLAGELILRLTSDSKPSVEAQEFMLYDRGMGTVFTEHPYLPFGLQPGRYDLGEGKLLTINSRGYRGAEFESSKSSGVRRILLVGDSYIYGYGLGDEQTLAARLAHHLPRSEVINAGFHGYYPPHYELFLRQEGFALAPDLLVVSLLPDNDLDDARFQVETGPDRQRDAFFVRDGRRYPTSLASSLAHLPLLEHSRAWYQLLQVFRQAEESARQEKYDANEARAEFERAVRAIHEGAKTRGIPVLFLLLTGGSVHTQGGPQHPVYRYMKEFLRTQGLPHFDTGPLVLKEPLEKLILRFRNELGAYTDLHHNAYANDRIAERLARILRERK